MGRLREYQGLHRSEQLINKYDGTEHGITTEVQLPFFGYQKRDVHNLQNWFWMHYIKKITFSNKTLFNIKILSSVLFLFFRFVVRGIYGFWEAIFHVIFGEPDEAPKRDKNPDWPVLLRWDIPSRFSQDSH